MKKKICVLLLILLLTGCKAKYNLQINFGGNFIESGNVSIDTNLMGKRGYSSDTFEFLNQIGSQYNFNNIIKKIPFNDGRYVGYDFYKRYANNIYYSYNSPAAKALFDIINITENNNYVKINASSNNIADFHNPRADIPYNVEEIEINISLPYKVVKNNADYIDSENNKYTWRFKSNSVDKTINLEYRSNEIYTENIVYLLKYVSPYIYITFLIIVISLIIIISLRSRMKHRNRI